MKSLKSPTLPTASFVIGAGLGGFLDGIVLHQILQWHHLVCVAATCQPQSIEEAKRQTRQDGFFHLAMWLVLLVGVVMLFRAAADPARRWTGRIFTGGLLLGWGVFNLVEGIIDHHILRIHHVMAGSPHEALADWLFLGLSAVLAIIGGLMAAERGSRGLP